MTTSKHIIVSEYITDAGLYSDTTSEHHSLYREGRAMRDALEEDFRLAGLEVHDSRWKPKPMRDHYGIVIAPETHSILVKECISILGERCISMMCSEEAILLTADKYELSCHFAKHNVSNPLTSLWKNPRNIWEEWPRNRLPMVVKPRDGCGSYDVYKIQDETDVLQIPVNSRFGAIVQDFVPGRAASIGFLIGPRQTVPLRPTFQVLSDDGRFKYQGGQFPIPTDLENRATKLGHQAVECVPGLRGYVGVDLVLGDAADGSQDYAIEINPRLATSYVGLRVLADFNIAQAMIDVVEGRPVDYVKWKPGRVRFWPDGRVEHDPTPGAVWE